MVIIIYDITKRETFDRIKNWMQEVEKYAGPNVIKLIVGNKSDLESERKVTKEEGQKLANESQIDFFEVSAKTNSNIEQLYEHSAKLYLKQKTELSDTNDSVSITSLEISQKKKGGLCFL